VGRKLTKREKQKVKKFALANWKTLLVLFLLVVIFVGFAYYMGWLDRILKKDEDFGDENLAYSLRVNFLDVGQADCMIIQLPDGKNMIIDSGDFDSDRQLISNFTNGNNITKFDYLLLTHQDRDHVGNMAWVIENYEIGKIFRPNNYSSHKNAKDLPVDFNPIIDEQGAYVSTSAAYANFLVAAYNEGCSVEVFNKDSDFENIFICDDKERIYKFDFLTPTAEKEDIKYSKANDYSPILMLEYAGKRIMFNGDAEEKALEEYVNTYGTTNNVDILKVGHHGSKNATSEEYINCIDPEFAVIQNDITESYKHPHKETLDILMGHKNGIEIYRNDCNGNIITTITNIGRILWDFEYDDMTYNHENGTKMLELKNNGNLNIGKHVNSVVNTLCDIWENIVFDIRKVA